MRRLLLASVPAFALVLSLLAAGCGSSSSGDDSTIPAGSGQAMNPSGKPPTEADAARAAGMRQQGEQMNAQRASQTQAMKEAMQRTGGK